jgi:hypothetical protein
MAPHRPTVKARTHYGTSSLDISIPADVIKEYDIHAGDVFEVTTTGDNKELKIIYKRVYSQPRL